MLDRVMRQANLLEKGLDAAFKKNEVLAGNIANADTPNYKAKRVKFESVFRSALKPDDFAARETKSGTNSPKHVAFEGEALQARVVEPNRTAMRMDGNNVDIDQEMTELAKNQIVYDTLTYTMSKELGRIRTVLQSGR